MSPARDVVVVPRGGHAGGRPAESRWRRVPFARLVYVELRKLTDTRSGRGILLAVFGATAAAMLYTLWNHRDAGGTSFAQLLSAAFTPQSMLVPILGVMTAANEWQHRTGLTTFAQEPHRVRVMIAKTSAALLLGLGMMAVTLGLAAASSLLTSSTGQGGEGTQLTAALVVNLLVKQVQGVLVGIALGAVFLNVPLGILAYFLLPTLAKLGFGLHPWLDDHSVWFDLYEGGAPLFTDAALSGTQWAQVATTSFLWVLLPMAVGFYRVRTEEVQ